MTEKTAERSKVEFNSLGNFGDADGDGPVSSADALLVLRASVGLDNISNKELVDIDD